MQINQYEMKKLHQPQAFEKWREKFATHGQSRSTPTPVRPKILHLFFTTLAKLNYRASEGFHIKTSNE